MDSRLRDCAGRAEPHFRFPSAYRQQQQGAALLEGPQDGSGLEHMAYMGRPTAHPMRQKQPFSLARDMAHRNSPKEKEPSAHWPPALPWLDNLHSMTSLGVEPSMSLPSGWGPSYA